MTTILVVGGAGYIGSHMVKMLLNLGCKVVVLDNLSTGYRDAVLGGDFVFGDLADSNCLDYVFRGYQFDAVIHFASLIQVGESVRKPDIYYQNNLVCSLNLINAMLRHKVKYLLFSSSAAIFGNPQRIPIDEQQPKNPINPYGLSKWMVEQILADYARAYDIHTVCLRYFNAAGADPEGQLGERHEPETHLIPLVLRVAKQQLEYINIFGDDYDTPDGTCIRDYIHINDLCQAHWLALQYAWHNQQSAAYNLGNGEGFSVREVIDVAQQVTGLSIPVIVSERRAGDPDRLVADASLARQKLGWQPQYPDLNTIISHAWNWENKH
jgi:UDP-glucose 4-epimerase